MGSKELHAQAKEVMPGGVSSPVRAYEPHPRYIACGKGARIEDVEGRSYVDVCMAFGALVLGHAPTAVVRALQEQAERGTLYGSPTEAEVDLARQVRKHFPSMEMVRFTSTGVEATMHALRVARAFTTRDDVVAMEGGYHGAHDALLVKAGSGAAEAALPASAGIPGDVVRHTHVVPYNDLEALDATLKRHEGRVAAVILEPILGNIGPVLPEAGYLGGVRRITQEHDVLLIFDEVITGFRLGMGGAQGLYGVRPDLTTLGKILGGGLPLGAFGGRREIMELIAPLGNVYQAGTFSGNPMSTTAGLATLGELARIGHGGMDRNATALRQGLGDILEDLGLEFTLTGIGSIFQIFLNSRPVQNYQQALASDRKLFLQLFQGLLERGVYLPASQMETCFMSTAHGEQEVEALLGAYRDALKGLRR